MITTVDGRKLDESTLMLDADGYWEQMDGALGLVKPSVEFEDRRKADAEAQALAAASAPPTRDEQLAILFTAIGADPALSDATKAAISQAVTVLRSYAQ